jgi:hypothetical protein
MLTEQMLVQYAKNREQNLETLHRAAKEYVRAYEAHISMLAVGGKPLAPSATELERARERIAEVSRFEPNNMAQAIGLTRRRR